jgi:hypothetical protein
MGDHFNTFYKSEKDGAVIDKIGVLGKMKIVLSGDQEFDMFDIKRRPQLSRQINWGGGGFFKYYELEQYEDVLKNSKYNNDRDSETYNFMGDEKMLDAFELDYEAEQIKIKFENLYSNVDISETLSNIQGKKIKMIEKDKVIFNDETEIKFDGMTFEKHPFIKPLIWWGDLDHE